MKTEARDMYWADLDHRTTTERAAQRYILKFALTIVGLALAWAGYVTIWNMLH